MTNRPSRNNSYISYASQLDEIYIDPSQEQSDPYFETLEGQEQQIDESHDKIFEEKYQHVNHRSHKHQSPTKNLPLNVQDSDINSLGYLTKQFMRLLRETKPNQCVDISEAARTLNVQKRRIYDITNVLQGIGYIEKVGKNLMRWVGGTKDQMEGELDQIQGRIEQYENKERHLNAQIEAMNKKIQQLSQLQNYFTMSELYQLMEKFNCTHMIVYNGYNGIEISVSQNTQSGKKQIMIESPPKSTKLGSVYVISKPKQQEGKQVYVIPVINQLCNDQQKNQNQNQSELKNPTPKKNQYQDKFLGEYQNQQGSQISKEQQFSNSKNQLQDLSLRQEKQSTLQFQQNKVKSQTPKTQKQPGLKSQSLKKINQKESVNINRPILKTQQNKKATKRNKSINSKDSKVPFEKKSSFISHSEIQLEKNDLLYFESDSQYEGYQ